MHEPLAQAQALAELEGGGLTIEEAVGGPLEAKALVGDAGADLAARPVGRLEHGNFQLGGVLRHGDVPPETLQRLRNGAERWGLSARAFTRCLRVARTVADLDASSRVESRHLDEALHFRAREAI
jgi:magnesium chelatase family protein